MYFTRMKVLKIWKENVSKPILLPERQCSLWCGLTSIKTVPTSGTYFVTCVFDTKFVEISQNFWDWAAFKNYPFSFGFCKIKQKLWKIDIIWKKWILILDKKSSCICLKTGIMLIKQFYSTDCASFRKTKNNIHADKNL